MLNPRNRNSGIFFGLLLCLLLDLIMIIEQMCGLSEKSVDKSFVVVIYFI